MLLIMDSKAAVPPWEGLGLAVHGSNPNLNFDCVGHGYVC